MKHITGAVITTTRETANAQIANITSAATTPLINKISLDLLENFFGLVSDNLKDVTGTVDVTNIVANVANSFGATNVTDYIDGVKVGDIKIESENS